MTHDESDHWQLVYGKRKGEFRGEAIAHRLEQTTHHHSNSITGQLSQHSKTSRPKPPSESLQATSLTTPPYLHSEGSNSQAMLKRLLVWTHMRPSATSPSTLQVEQLTQAGGFDTSVDASPFSRASATAAPPTHLFSLLLQPPDATTATRLYQSTGDHSGHSTRMLVQR